MFQNKVLIDDVYSGGSREDGDEMLLSEAMEKGLFHPNCEYDVATYFEGVNIIPKVDEKEEKEYNEDKELHKSTNENRKYYSKVSKSDFNKITHDFIKNGGIIQNDKDAQKYLHMRNADGICFNESLIFIRPDCFYTELL